MGCSVICPFLPNRYEEDWGLEDPVGKSIDELMINACNIENIE
jgi:arsenate reductase (thioredoxin)